MATRWQWSDARIAMLAIACALGAACTTTSTTTYLPDTTRDRYDADAARQQLDLFLLAECPRIIQEKKPMSGMTRVIVQIDPTGVVQNSRLATTLGDTRLDGIFGAVSAQMKFDAPKDGKAHESALQMGYACTSTGGASTIQAL